ncbi:tripartite tricarboxylate transporter substrate binding protein (plasmid) [Diaphorobacter sp. HDW4B]|uniref:Bug family tripartite tricarboxylate transporter substrate binding protein n=1 Tax=Diaphorobacter sp. HDW4B TaxID=2714925 RepID=UPI00140969B4|nr:tripartite tricarboxylate transporter substrate-binding protein [Diaphorobacter sp. HDW4B]QIL74353.1 tripartite tricarboxylate transporter substrate binding protein [Diaphorobacter sp. HDW4B]
MKRLRLRLSNAFLHLCAGSAAMLLSSAVLASECIAPAKPRAGFDLTCELLRVGLPLSNPDIAPMTVNYMPGGIGAVTFNAIITQRNAEPDTLVAFSGGSLFGISQGRFGKYGVNDVRWLAGIGVDHGVLIVRSNSPYRKLTDLLAALNKNPEKVVMGGSGTVGSQDWMKAALIAKAARLGRNAFRFVGFEGGGEANEALQKGYVDVVSGDYSEALGLIRNGAQIRILTVLAPSRLPHQPAEVLTAKEEGIDIVWSNIRGLYMGPRVPDADYSRWVARMDRLLASAAFVQLRTDKGLLPLAQTGQPFSDQVQSLVRGYQQLLKESGWTVLPP